MYEAFSKIDNNLNKNYILKNKRKCNLKEDLAVRILMDFLPNHQQLFNHYYSFKLKGKESSQ